MDDNNQSKRAIQMALDYLRCHEVSLRDIAEMYDVCKTTVHRNLTVVLPKVHPKLAMIVARKSYMRRPNFILMVDGTSRDDVGIWKKTRSESAIISAAVKKLEDVPKKTHSPKSH